MGNLKIGDEMRRLAEGLGAVLLVVVALGSATPNAEGSLIFKLRGDGSSTIWGSDFLDSILTLRLEAYVSDALGLRIDAAHTPTAPLLTLPSPGLHAGAGEHVLLDINGALGLGDLVRSGLASTFGDLSADAAQAAFHLGATREGDGEGYHVLTLPEPASFIVWFLIGLTWAGSGWTYQYRRRWQKWQQEEAMAAEGCTGNQPDRCAGHADQLEGQIALPTTSGQLPGDAGAASAGG